MQDCAVFDTPFAALAGIAVPCKNGFPEGGDAVSLPMLVIRSLRERPAFLSGFQHLCIKIPHFQGDPCDWDYFADA